LASQPRLRTTPTNGPSNSGSRPEVCPSPKHGRCSLESARLGHPKAQAAVAHVYFTGSYGVRTDLRQAAYWNGLAAAQGHRGAQYNLGGMYTDGLGGLPVNLQKAASLFEASARQGYAPSQQALGICYEFGEGVPRNRRNAIYWLDSAAAQGDDAAGVTLSWLKQPNTPNFQSEKQLGDYILEKAQAANATPSQGNNQRPHSWQYLAWVNRTITCKCSGGPHPNW
jgi:TPR repeat protein